MPTIIVTRGAGLRQGEDIVDYLLSEVAVQLARGRTELDETYLPLKEVSMETVFRNDVVPGQLAEVNDALQGANYRGKITSVSHRVVGGVVTTRTDMMSIAGEPV